MSALHQMVIEMDRIITLAKEMTRRYHMEIALREAEQSRLLDDGCPNVREEE